jgi:hypothetical protein
MRAQARRLTPLASRLALPRWAYASRGYKPQRVARGTRHLPGSVGRRHGPKLAAVLASLVMASTLAVLSGTRPAAASSWSIESTPSGFFTDDLNGVSCTSPTTCTAVGSSAVSGGILMTLVEDWNGSSWSVVPSPSVSSANNFLQSVSCTSSSACTAVGYTEQTNGGEYNQLIESWNGVIWSIVSNPSLAQPSSELLSVSCISPTACTAVGFVGGTDDTLVETWDGSSWSVISSPNYSSANFLHGVSCTSATECMAVGQYWVGNEVDELTLAEEWNGTSWTVVSSPNPSGYNLGNVLSSVSCISATACTAVGDYPNGTLIETWDGSSWSIEPSPNASSSAGGDFLNGVSCTSLTACTAVGYEVNSENVPQTLVETWDGSTWSIEPSPSISGVSNFPESVSCTSESACTAVGDDYSSVTSTNHSLALSTNSAAVGQQLALTATPGSQIVGKTVTLTATLQTANGKPISNASIFFRSIAGPNVNTFAAYVSTNAGGTAQTTMGSAGPGTDTVQALVDSNDNGVADPGEPVATTTVTWTPVPISVGPVLMIHGLDATAPYGINCATTWNDAKSFLRTHGYDNRQLLTLAYYADDQNCDRSINSYVDPALGENYFDNSGSHVGNTSGHTAQAPIEHLAYHLAWFIYDEYSKNNISVDVLAHSMGGLMIRYALGQVQAKNSAFPPSLIVNNVVTFGTPHGGAKSGKEAECDFAQLFGVPYECTEMRAGSSFLTTLQAQAWNPQGSQGTDWTAIGSDGDKSVAADRAVGTSVNMQTNLYFGACHKDWYPTTRIEGSGRHQHTVSQNIGHDDYMHNGSIVGGMSATNLLLYSSGTHCGAPLSAMTQQPTPMGLAALALDSPDY